MAERPYPLGIFGPSNGPPDNPQTDLERGEDPSYESGEYREMSKGWQPVKICMGGTQTFREHAKTLLPQEPREDEKAWKRRIGHGVLSPFLTRIADQAAGLITRKPVAFEPWEPDGEIDPWWNDVFSDNIDGYGVNLTAFARDLVYHSLLFGHAAVLTDYTAREVAANLQEERDRGDRPYWLMQRADMILGHRKDGDSPISPVTQVRLAEYIQESVGSFGQTLVKQIRVLEPGGWRIFRKLDKGWEQVDQGVTSLNYIPLAVTYSKKISELVSAPPLLPVAHLNLEHAKRQADLSFALHVSSQPILTLSGFDDGGSNEIALSSNAAILLPPEGSAGYVEPAAGAFDSQQSYLSELEGQMRSLGISTLFQQTFVGETSEAKAMDRSDSDSLLAIVSADLQNALQNATNTVAEFMNMEAPQVVVSRDFNLQSLDSGQVGQYMSMHNQGVISHQTLLEVLVRGEVLSMTPEEIESEIEMIEAGKLDSLDIDAAGGVFAEPEEKAEKEEEESDVRKQVVARLKKQAEDAKRERENGQS